jgi:hypothetical protein
MPNGSTQCQYQTRAFSTLASEKSATESAGVFWLQKKIKRQHDFLFILTLLPYGFVTAFIYQIFSSLMIKQLLKFLVVLEILILSSR